MRYRNGGIIDEKVLFLNFYKTYKSHKIKYHIGVRNHFLATLFLAAAFLAGLLAADFLADLFGVVAFCGVAEAEAAWAGAAGAALLGAAFLVAVFLIFFEPVDFLATFFGALFCPVGLALAI